MTKPSLDQFNELVEKDGPAVISPLDIVMDARKNARALARAMGHSDPESIKLIPPLEAIIDEAVKRN